MPNELEELLSYLQPHEKDELDRLLSGLRRSHVPSLAEFVKESWAVIEGSNPLLWNWHMDAICLHVEAALLDWMHKQDNWEYHQRIQNCLFNVPPGSGKSRILSVCTPAWFWLHCPSWRALFLSANPRVSLRDSVYCRDLIESKWYQESFKPRWQLRLDQNAKSSFWNTEGGARSAAGMNSRVTGDRVDCILVDDPHDASEVQSEAKRQSVIDKWDSAIRNRVNDLRSSVRFGIMQRLHSADWSAHVSKQDQWTVIVIPQEYEPTDYVSPIGWADPRSQSGEPMFPERFPPAVLQEEKTNLGTYGYAAQHQQRPVPLGGGLIKEKWIPRYGEPLMRYDQVVQSWDTANKKGVANCPWSCTTWGISNGVADLLHAYTQRHDYPDGKRAVANLYRQWQPQAVLIEDKSSGISLIQDCRSPEGIDGAHVPAIAIHPEGDKITRMATEAPMIEAGRVRFPQAAPWLPDFEAVIFNYPNSAINDPVDSLSQFLKWWRVRSQVMTVSAAPVTTAHPYGNTF